MNRVIPLSQHLGNKPYISEKCKPAAMISIETELIRHTNQIDSTTSMQRSVDISHVCKLQTIWSALMAHMPKISPDPLLPCTRRQQLIGAFFSGLFATHQC